MAGKRSFSRGPDVGPDVGPEPGPAPSPERRRLRETGPFLEKRSYRRRRLLDGLRLLPVLGVWLFMVPLLWPESADGSGLSTVPMSRALIYIFAVWLGLIVLSGILVRAQGSTDASEDPNSDKAG